MGDLIKKYDGGHFTEGLFYDTIKPMENSSEKLFYTLITGATGGIGRAFAETLAAKGQNLFLTGRSADKLNVLKEELSSKYPSLRIIVFACDLTDESSRAEMYETIDAQGVVFDRLCNGYSEGFRKIYGEKDRLSMPRQSRSDPFGDAVRFVAPRGRVGDRHDLQYVGRLSHAVFRAVQRHEIGARQFFFIAQIRT